MNARARRQRLGQDIVVRRRSDGDSGAGDGGSGAEDEPDNSQPEDAGLGADGAPDDASRAGDCHSGSKDGENAASSSQTITKPLVFHQGKVNLFSIV